MARILVLIFLLNAGLASAQTFTGAGGVIPDAGDAVCFPLNVSGIGNINGAYGLSSICVNINHPWDADLEIILKSPDGTKVPLSIQNGGTGSNYTGTCFAAS